MTYLMNNYARLPVKFVRGKGVYLYDEEGKEYLDFVSGIGVNSLGHAYPKLTEALKEQVEKLLHVSNLYENPWQEELAHKLVKHFWTEGKVFFANSGTESVEAAIKLARKYWRDKGKNKWKFISFENSFHGRTYGSLSATGQPKFHKGFEPLVPGFSYAKLNDIDSVYKLLDEETAGIIIEVIQGEGGVNEASEDFLSKLQEICKEKDVLLIIDEVQTGIGRTGEFYAYQHFNLKPDVIALAKGLGGGVPIGAILAREEVAQSFTPGSHGSTFGGNPLACRAGTVVVDEVEKLLPHVREVGNYFKEKLKELGKGKVKGRGLMLGLELERECKDYVLKALEKGLLINCTAGKVLRFLPPLIIQKEHIDRAISVLREIL
ncbi:aspartate aminotransferase family protein [Aquifex aeolicus]|uniref:Acetylornithine aminotransferase n=2 Tax=Aquifex aeolicus (strain VF5) TaxID=224324 RepID=ARGD_AQUAE|nr:aspartate aminotransferase family protein [Aquifex aeolicus]O66442.1 RecName: Full=Acetylornithine aminotransferase; Short=ACOAT [Aquifex aeolicus VF5]AAC06390.1 N-acetylornithine aminotransferase [Aquifex aeolicus VF5]